MVVRDAPGGDRAAAASTPLFGELLRRHRRAAGLSQEELAEQAQLSPRGLRYLEQGMRSPQPDTVRRLVAALKLSTDEAAELRSAANAPTAQRVIGLAELPPHGDLVGRHEELAEALELVRSGCRLLTVLGPGGVGKTRFAIELAQELASEFTDGVVWVPLAGLRSGREVAPAVLGALGGAVAAGRSEPDSVLTLLRARRVLLLLDNFEHLASAADFVGRLVATCPRLAVVTTSRAPLRLGGEHEFWLTPLAVPERQRPQTREAVAASPAVQLFSQRALLVDRTFRLTDGNAADVAELCRRLEGLPLALELAAPRIRVLPPAALVAELSRGLDLLAGGPRDAPARHRSLRATLNWSYDLLKPPAQRLLRTMSVFAGGCTFSALRAVLPPAADGRANLVDVLDLLQRNSLVQRSDPPGAHARYTLLETVRLYAREQLVGADEEGEVSDLHARFFSTLGLEAAGRLEGPGQAAAVRVLEQEHDNLRASLQWLLQARPEDGLNLSGNLWAFWYVRGYFDEGRRYLSSFLDATPVHPPRTARAKALLGAGQLARAQEDYDEARGLMEGSIEAYRQLNDPVGTAFALFGTGFVADMQEDYPSAREYFHASLGLALESQNHYAAALALHHLGLLALELDGDLATAQTLLDQSLRTFRLVGFPRHVALVLSTLGNVACRECRLSDSRALHAEALALLLDTGQTPDIHWVLEGFSELAAAEGDLRESVRLASVAEHQRAAFGEAEWNLVRRNRQRRLQGALEKLGATAYQQAWESGEDLTPEEAAALVLGRTHTVGGPLR